MSAGDLAVTLAAVLCAIGFAALVVVLVRVHDLLRDLRGEVAALRSETRPLLTELRAAADGARSDLERFDRVLGSAEAISDAVEGSGRAARHVFSAPVIKIAGLATGTSRAVRRLRGTSDAGSELVHIAKPRRAGRTREGRERA
jgi:uncharacterized protein YoxC